MPPSPRLPFASLVCATAVLAISACGEGKPDKAPVAAAIVRKCAAIADTPVKLAGGTFEMGEEDVYDEEGPVRTTTVHGFWIDPHEVTNRQFAAFVTATHYVTVAEKPVDPKQFNVPADQIPPDMLKPGSAVFTPPVRSCVRSSFGTADTVMKKRSGASCVMSAQIW